MNVARTFTLSVLVFIGCTHERRSGSLPPPSWPRELTADEKARCKEVAWDAAASPAMLDRFKVVRISREPIKLSERGINFWIWDQTNFASFEVLVPSGGRIGWHSCFIGVTVARGTYEVLSMRESFWP
jgi:hypothetical protein